MAAHRYWRATNLTPYGFAGLDLSQFQLISGVARVDASAALTSSQAPDAGALASLQDGLATNSASWSATKIKSLALSWDFGGAPKDVTNIVLGGGASFNPATFPLSLKLQFSDDGSTWTDFAVVRSIAWPGRYAMTTSELVDPYADLVALLLHGTGTNGSTSIVDSSDTRKTPTLIGSPQISTAQSKFGGSSISFPTNPSLALYPHTADLHLNGEFTIEGWLYLLDVTTVSNVLNKGGGANIAWASYDVTVAAGNLRFAASSTNTGYDIGGENGSANGIIGAVSINTWYHFAVTRSGNTYRGFLNGVLGFTQTVAATPYDASPRGLAVGATFGTSWGVPGNAGGGIRGYLDDLRITNGAARYTAAFTPPAATFALGPGFGNAGASAAPTPTPYAPTLSQGYFRGTKETTSFLTGRQDYYSGLPGSQFIGRISGTTKETSLPVNRPVSRRLRLHRQIDGMVMRELWSSATTGAYSFDYIDETLTYYVCAFDHTGNFRGVIGDKLVPDLIGSAAPAVPAAYYRAVGAPSLSSSASSIALAFPLATAVGDLLVALVVSYSAPGAAPPGWSAAMSTGPATNGTANLYATVYTKAATSADIAAGSTTFAQATAGVIQGQVMGLYGNVGTPALDPASAGAVYSNTSGATQPQAPSVAVGQSKSIVFFLAAALNANSSLPTSYTFGGAGSQWSSIGATATLQLHFGLAMWGVASPAGIPAGTYALNGMSGTDGNLGLTLVFNPQ